MDTLRTLFTPLNYLRAHNSQKSVWDWLLPVLFSFAATVCIFFLPKPVSILAEQGLIYWINELLQVLVGFYIAALAAIASFTRPSLDQLIEGDGVTLNVLSHGEKVDKPLTRRAFLSLLFGYLSMLSISLYCGGAAVILLKENIHQIELQYLTQLRIGFIFIYMFFFAQLIAVTLVGIFYLSDRIHRNTPTALPAEDVDAAKQESEVA